MRCGRGKREGSAGFGRGDRAFGLATLSWHSTVSCPRGSAAFYAVCAAFSFKGLIVLNVWLYSLSLLVELEAFIWLRVVAPDLPRPWRVPGGFGGAVVVVFPTLFMLGALATAGWRNTAAGLVGAVSGPLAWAVLSRRVRER